MWEGSKCSQRPKEEPARDWNVRENFLEVVELEQGSKVLVEFRKAGKAGDDIVSRIVCISSSYSLGYLYFTANGHHCLGQSCPLFISPPHLD